jgi:hypothetical protein
LAIPGFIPYRYSLSLLWLVTIFLLVTVDAAELADDKAEQLNVTLGQMKMTRSGIKI